MSSALDSAVGSWRIAHGPTLSPLPQPSLDGFATPPEEILSNPLTATLEDKEGDPYEFTGPAIPDDSEAG
jgi:hypothetical protein